MDMLTGKALTTAELEQKPTVLRFHVIERSLIDNDQEANMRSGGNTDFGVELRTSVIFQCPVGPHSDPRVIWGGLQCLFDRTG